jgi:hypothetical protein
MVGFPAAFRAIDFRSIGQIVSHGQMTRESSAGSTTAGREWANTAIAMLVAAG